MRKRDKLKRFAIKAKESLVLPYYQAKDKFKKTFNIPTELNWDKFMNIRIRCFHATNNVEIAKIYMSGQQDVLKEFNVVGITSAKNNTWENENTYIFIAENIKTGEIGAGMRLDVADSTHKLPLEMALESKVGDLSERIHRFDNIIAESCGWWVKKNFSERRIPKHLLAASIAIAPKLRIKVVVAFTHQHTFKIADSIGFTTAKTIGENHGQFYYPDERYLSTVVELDTYTLNTVPETEKNMILDLRANPKQSFEVNNKGYKTIFNFDLRLY
jgi:hypothetical protein